MSLWSKLFGGKRAQIDGPTARRMVGEGALLLDVRSPGEFAGGHAEGALNVPVEDLERRLAEIPAGRVIVVYCRSGIRSARAAGVLERSGRGPVHDLGSLSAW